MVARNARGGGAPSRRAGGAWVGGSLVSADRGVARRADRDRRRGSGTRAERICASVGAQAAGREARTRRHDEQDSVRRPRHRKMQHHRQCNPPDRLGTSPAGVETRATAGGEHSLLRLPTARTACVAVTVVIVVTLLSKLSLFLFEFTNFRERAR